MTNKNYLILTAHDFRTASQANMHFIARSLQKKGQVYFFSLRFSFISFLKKDVRCQLKYKANYIDSFENVYCFLWRTFIHPLSIPFRCLNFIERFISYVYHQYPHPVLVDWVIKSDYIIIESGISCLFINSIKIMNPYAKLIYIASDLLQTIGASRSIFLSFHKYSHLIDKIIITSSKMRPFFSSKKPVIHIPHGIDSQIKQMDFTNPFVDGINAVSIGSMLFDSEFFAIAAHLFPGINFHIIGCGLHRWPNFPLNINVYDEMPFLETIRYIKYARFGIAPYIASRVHPYLADTSMKLMYYDFFGLPSVCPSSVAEGYLTRFGYESNNPFSIFTAISAALSCSPCTGSAVISWDEVVDQILSFPPNQAAEDDPGRTLSTATSK